MGVLNITPDSFSDGALYLDVNAACLRAREMVSEGADLIDLGGEASHPFAKEVSVDEELSRIIPVIRAIRETSDVCISVDTRRAVVMYEAVNAGASMINDISALTGVNSLEMASKLNVPICLMHMKGTPQNMQSNPEYQIGVVEEINQFFDKRINACIKAGIPRENLILDPGIGFGKLVLHNLQILKQISEFRRHQLPLLLGVSRKQTIGVVLNQPVSKRLFGGLAIAVYAMLQGVQIFRTHDVEQTKQALFMVGSIIRA